MKVKINTNILDETSDEKINNCNNFYLKEVINNSYEDTNVTETFYKDKKEIIKDKDSIVYKNAETGEYLILRLNDKMMLSIGNKMNNTFKGMYFNSVFLWIQVLELGKKFLLAFKVKINTESCDGKECYVIKTSYDAQVYVYKNSYMKARNEIHLIIKKVKV